MHVGRKQTMNARLDIFRCCPKTAMGRPLWHVRYVAGWLLQDVMYFELLEGAAREACAVPDRAQR